MPEILIIASIAMAAVVAAAVAWAELEALRAPKPSSTPDVAVPAETARRHAA